jgi:hypothetical protein
MIDAHCSCSIDRDNFEMSDVDWNRIRNEHKVADGARPEINNLVTLFRMFERGMDRDLTPARLALDHASEAADNLLAALDALPRDAIDALVFPSRLDEERKETGAIVGGARYRLDMIGLLETRKRQLRVVKYRLSKAAARLKKPPGDNRDNRKWLTEQLGELMRRHSDMILDQSKRTLSFLEDVFNLIGAQVSRNTIRSYVRTCVKIGE